jgi:diacylglycerol kinase
VVDIFFAKFLVELKISKDAGSTAYISRGRNIAFVWGLKVGQKGT